jgi:hypothetical protein
MQPKMVFSSGTGRPGFVMLGAAVRDSADTAVPFHGYDRHRTAKAE